MPPGHLRVSSRWRGPSCSCEADPGLIYTRPVDGGAAGFVMPTRGTNSRAPVDASSRRKMMAACVMPGIDSPRRSSCDLQRAR